MSLGDFPDIECQVFLDIGCADGSDTIAYARRYSDAQVFGFEPVSSNVSMAREAVQREQLSDRVTIHDVALGDINATAPFHASSTPWSGSLLRPQRHPEFWPAITFHASEAQVRRFDGLAPALKIQRVDFIHIDVQGAELRVFSGMGAYFKTVRAVWMEVERVALYEDQPLVEDVFRFMSANGFTLVRDEVGAVDGDQLWVRR